MRVKLSVKYEAEREEICKKLMDILNLDEEKSFILYELDTNIEKQTTILGMKDEIQRCFACSSISSFKPSVECKRPYLNIIRGILKQQGYLVIGRDVEIKLDDGTKRTKKYRIFRNVV